MRFQPNQTLFAVHFGHNKDVPNTYGFFSMPMMFNDIEPDDINFIKLEVTEHHKVPNAYDAEKKLECDGYLLKDETGRVFANQYPLASYGQISDEGNRRFGVHITKKGMLDKLQAENPKVIFEGHLLSDVLQRIQRGIKELKEVTGDNAAHCCAKAGLLEKLYERIVKEFGEKYPDYRIDMAWKPLWNTEVMWPEVTIYKLLTPEMVLTTTREALVKDFIGNGRIEIECAPGDRFVIENASGKYSINGETTEVKTINVYFAEKVEEDGKPAFFVHQTEYFPQSWVTLAVECFLERFKSDSFKAINMGMSIEAIAAKDKEPEGIVQVRE